jgi:hypothetical protein
VSDSDTGCRVLTVDREDSGTTPRRHPRFADGHATLARAATIKYFTRAMNFASRGAGPFQGRSVDAAHLRTAPISPGVRRASGCIRR